MNLWTLGRTPWMGDQPVANLHMTTQHRKTWTHIHASSGFWICDPSVQVVEDSTCLKPCSH